MRVHVIARVVVVATRVLLLSADVPRDRQQSIVTCATGVAVVAGVRMARHHIVQHAIVPSPSRPAAGVRQRPAACGVRTPRVPLGQLTPQSSSRRRKRRAAAGSGAMQRGARRRTSPAALELQAPDDAILRPRFPGRSVASACCASSAGRGCSRGGSFTRSLGRSRPAFLLFESRCRRSSLGHSSDCSFLCCRLRATRPAFWARSRRRRGRSLEARCLLSLNVAQAWPLASARGCRHTLLLLRIFPIFRESQSMAALERGRIAVRLDNHRTLRVQVFLAVSFRVIYGSIGVR